MRGAAEPSFRKLCTAIKASHMEDMEVVDFFRDVVICIFILIMSELMTNDKRHE